MKGAEPAQVLLVEDNPADARLIREAFRNGKSDKVLTVVPDGVEAISYLRREGRYADAERPDLMLLDLNLPKKGGRDVLKEIKADDDLKSIPVVVFSSSGSERDISECYGLSANSYVIKPTELDDFLAAIGSIDDFWLTVAKGPKEEMAFPRVTTGLASSDLYAVGADIIGQMNPSEKNESPGPSQRTGEPPQCVRRVHRERRREEGLRSVGCPAGAEPIKRTRYILTLSADPNWPDECFVPRPDALEQELIHHLGEPIVLQAQARAYNQSASGERFYELEAGQTVSATEIKNVLVRRIEQLRDPCFLGVPIRVILSALDGKVVSKGSAHPGPHR